MAEIDIERKPKQSSWPWALAVLLLLLVVGFAWYYTQPGNQRPGVPDLLPDSAGTPAQPGANRP